MPLRRAIKRDLGIIVTMLIGVAGALIGGFLAAALFDAHPLDDFFDISTRAHRSTHPRVNSFQNSGGQESEVQQA